MRRRSGCAPRLASGSARWMRCWRTRRWIRAISGKPWLLAPIDLQAIKAAGVTFVLSMIERVIEERARGDLSAAAEIRDGRQPAGRRRSGETEAGFGGGGASEAGADRARRLEPVPGGRHRAGRGDLHQGAADGRGRHRHGCGDSPELVVEQSGAGGGAGCVLDRPDRRRDAGQRREPARRGRAVGAVARQGEGQQRVVRDRAVPAVVRCALHVGRYSAARRFR